MPDSHTINILFRYAALVLVCVFLSGCSHHVAIPTIPAAPVSENVPFDNPYQRSLQSAAQWHVVAEDMANQLVETVKSKKLADKPIFIHTQNKPSSFNRAFDDFLITTLVNKGVRVSREARGSRIFNYKLQLLEYNAYRETVVNNNFRFSLLGAGFIVFRNVAKVFGVDGTALATGVALDSANFNYAPNFEVIITASVMEGNLFLARTTDIYYANASDKHLYTPTQQQKAADVFNEPFYQMK